MGLRVFKLGKVAKNECACILLGLVSRGSNGQ